MLVPVTALDREYSDPAATETFWEQTRRVIETAELFWISTVRADGRPHVTPVVAAWWDDAIWFSTGADDQKFANLREPARGADHRMHRFPRAVPRTETAGDGG